MTVSVSEPNSVTGDGDDANFTFSFSPIVIYANTDLVVTRVDSDGTETNVPLGTGATDFSVSLTLSDFPSTGSITYPADSSTPLPTGSSLVIQAVYPLEQGTVLRNQGGYNANVVEIQFDKVVRLIKQVNADVTNALTAPIGDLTDAATLVLPSKAERADKYFTWDSDGEPSTAAPISATVSGAMEPVIAASTLAAARTAMGVAGSPLDEVLDTNDFAVDFSEGSSVASAGTTDIWAEDGNTVHVTGTTTITSLGTAPRVGASRWVIFDGALTLTDGANLLLPGGANITTAAGDIAYVYADTTTLFRVAYFPKDGKQVIALSWTDGEIADATDGEIPTWDTDGTPTTIAVGTSGQVLTSAGAGAVPTWEDAASGMTIISEQVVADMSSGSPTDHLFSSLAGARRITLVLVGASSSGTDDKEITIGPTGGLETSGYVSNAINPANNAADVATTDAWNLDSQASAAAVLFDITLDFILVDPSADVWAIFGMASDRATRASMILGTKTLAGPITQLNLGFSGSDTWDAGVAYLVAYG